MARRRVAVALIPPPEIAAAVQTLRTVLADPRLEDLPPHLTLVPPVNVADATYDEGVALLRAVAASTPTFVLGLGPTGSFAPNTPTLHLELSGEVDALVELRARLRTGAFGRPDEWPFHPHVTLREELGEPARSGAIAALTGELGPWTVDRVHLLEQRRDDDGRRRWEPVVEELFGAVVVVGRGGVELELRATRSMPGVVAELLHAAGVRPTLGTSQVVGSRGGLVIVATSPADAPSAPPLGAVWGELLGSSSGRVALLDSVAVDRTSRRQGIGRQLLRRWSHLAEVAGASMAVHDPPLGAPGGDGSLEDLLEAEGFVPVGTAHVRQLRTG